MSIRVILIPLAILTVIALALLAFQVTRSPNAPPPEVAAAPPPPLLVSVLVAAHQVAPGTLVRDEDFVAKPLPQRDVVAGAIQDSPDSRAEIRGALVRRFLDAGAILTRADLLRSRDRGFLAAVLEPGTRAVSVAVDAVTGVSGLIWPGDRVDVILTQEMEGQNVPLARRIFGETVLSDVRIIAVDQQIAEGGVAAAGNEGVGKVARTVTLQVASDQAERVAVAGRMGHIALAVRAIESPVRDTSGTAKTTVFGSDVSPEVSASAHRTGSHMRLIQGGQREEVTFQ